MVDRQAVFEGDGAVVLGDVALRLQGIYLVYQYIRR